MIKTIIIMEQRDFSKRNISCVNLKIYGNMKTEPLRGRGNFARDPRSKGALECNMKTHE
jgi:hypothetical protein